MPRSRSKAVATGNAYFGQNGQAPSYTWSSTSYSALVDEKTKPCNCVQEHKSLYSINATSPDLYYYGEQVGFHVEPSATFYIVGNLINSLNWKKLPSSNEAGLLQNLAELDDTVAMLGKKLVSSLSYGGYKWGWAPLLNDIAAVNDTVVRCAKEPPGSQVKYNDENTVSKEIKVDMPNGGQVRHKWTLKTKYEGFVTTDLNILSYYDFLGFHPSPKVIWDLVPLSFAADWVLPIGDALDRISPAQGWVKSVNFTGWQCVTAICEETITKPWGFWTTVEISGNLYRRFQRNYVSGLHLEQKTVHKEIGLKWPTFSNVLDYAYLANSYRKRR